MGNFCYKTRMASKSNIGFLGAGKMATALAKGFIHAEVAFPKEIMASDPHDAARTGLNKSSLPPYARNPPATGIT